MEFPASNNRCIRNLSTSKLFRSIVALLLTDHLHLLTINRRFVPNLGFHQYSNVHYEPSVPVVVPTVPEAEETPSYVVEDTPQETYGPPKPYPPAPEPHEEYGVPSTTLAPPSPTYGPPPHPTYGPPPPQTYGPPPPETYGLPNTYSSSSFQIPKTSYGVPAGPSYHLTQRF